LAGQNGWVLSSSTMQSPTVVSDGVAGHNNICVHNYDAGGLFANSVNKNSSSAKHWFSYFSFSCKSK